MELDIEAERKRLLGILQQLRQQAQQISIAIFQHEGALALLNDLEERAKENKESETE